MSHTAKNLAQRKVLIDQYIVQADRLGSYEERKAKHQANVAEMQKQIADPDYTPTYDPSAYSKPAEEVIAETGTEVRAEIQEVIKAKAKEKVEEKIARAKKVKEILEKLK